MALARRLRDESAIRIVMLTSRREEADRVMWKPGSTSLIPPTSTLKGAAKN